MRRTRHGAAGGLTPFRRRRRPLGTRALDLLPGTRYAARHPRGDLAGRLAATQNNSLKGRARYHLPPCLASEETRAMTTSIGKGARAPEWRTETQLVHGGI